MPAKKTAAKKAAKSTEKSFEESLWDTATKLRGSVESSEYKHVVLSLISSSSFRTSLRSGGPSWWRKARTTTSTWTTRQGCQRIAEIVEELKVIEAEGKANMTKKKLSHALSEFEVPA